MEAWIQRPEAFMETAVVLVTERNQGTPREVAVDRVKTDLGQRNGGEAGGIVIVLEVE